MEQRLSNEFQNQAKLLHDMEEQICNYEIANKKEVANRLKDQLSLLKVSYFVLYLFYYITSGTLVSQNTKEM